MFINARFLAQPLSGTQRYAQQLLEAFDARLGERTGPPVVALAPRQIRRRPTWRNIELRVVGRGGGHVWEQSELAWAARSGWLLSLVSSAPVLHPRQVVTLHDAALYDQPHHFSRSYTMLHRTIRPLIARRAQRILTVSAFSAAALSKALAVPRDKFALVPNGADHLLRVPSDPETLDRRKLRDRGYVLFVGNEAPHKNVATAVRAFTSLGRQDLDFVTVGIGLSSVFGTLDVAQDRAIRRLRDVGDGELRALLEHAALLVFPSLYEGFGIPPLEAMALGCPVVSSNQSAMPEVLGNSAEMVDPTEAGLRDGMRRVLESPARRVSLVERGRARAAAFTWAEASRKLDHVLMDVMDARG